MVSVFPENLVAKVVSARVAGLFTTAPLVLYCEPWQGQMNVVPDTFVTVQPSCVHTAVRAENPSEIVARGGLHEGRSADAGERRP